VKAKQLFALTDLDGIISACHKSSGLPAGGKKNGKKAHLFEVFG
jgi:hypothetical protein